MSGSQQLLLGGIPTAAPVDPYFYSVTSLLHGDGVNGGQNNTFLDSSSNNFTITRNGNTTQGSFSPFSQTGWSNYFDGSGDYLTFPNNTAFAFGTGAFTIEFWVNGPLNNDKFFLSGRAAIGTMHITTGGAVGSTAGALRYVGSSTITSGSAVVTNDTWNHCAIVRDGSNNITLYVNGASVGTGTDTTNYTTTSGTWYIASNDVSAPANILTAYLSNLRIVKGTAVYTSNFTPPTTPLTAISGTSLLTCQANRFRDASTNNFTITRNGDTSVQPFSPFNPITPYSTSAVGGSGYFDGSGDSLTLSGNPTLTTNFTIEFWFYMPSWGDRVFLSQGGGAASFSTSNGVAFQIYSTSTTFYAQWSNGAGSFAEINTATSGIATNAWHHVAIGNNGTTTRVWIDGVSVGTNTGTPTWGYPTTRSTYIGYISYASSYVGFGYMAGVRMVTSDVYGAGNTTITVPTAPPTAIANTQLLCNFTNGAIFDNAAVADYETVGNAQISTSVKKYGTGSMYFDGTGDYLVSPGTQSLTFGTGDFTIEFWLYLNVLNTDQLIFDMRPASTQGAYPALYFADSGDSLNYAVDGNNRITSGAITSGVWYHVAICRAASQTKMFINGTQAGVTYADTNSYLCNRLVVGAQSFTLGNGPLNGYIDDMRISKGIARYTYNFTPPTAEFPNIGGTVTLTADPYFDYTTLLLPGNGTNGAQNNTFLDSSSNAFTITRNGNTTQGTFSPFSQTGWGNYFDGTGDYLSVPDAAAFTLGTSDFCMESWVYPVNAGTGASESILGQWSSASYGWIFQYRSNKLLMYYSTNGSSTTNAIDATATIVNNAWNHIAFVRSGNTLSAYVNGVRVSTNASFTASIVNSSSTVNVGRNGDNSEYVTGYLSNTRLVVGSSVYDPTQASFTVPTSPLTAITNTSLLTCQSNRFIDNSSNNFTITRNGDVSVQAFSPFNPTAAWSAATYGGSGYFDGSGDYLTTNATQAIPATGDFTIEAWVYPTVSGPGRNIVSQGTAGTSGRLQLNVHTDNTLQFAITSTIVYSTGTVQPFAWNYVAVTRTGSSVAFYINGASAGTATLSGTVQNTTLSVGSEWSGDPYRWLGYLTSVRISNTLRTISSSPTAPLTSDGNTVFLCNFTNAGIYDATSKNDLETVGNAQISTTQSKFGGSSMYFDGTGDWLIGRTTDLASFGTGDFTIEGWLYPSAVTGADRCIWDTRAASGDAGMVVFIGTAGTMATYSSGSVRVVSTNALSANTWQHFALCRYNGTMAYYINGVQNGTLSYTSAITCPGRVSVAVRFDDAAPYTGYINDLRITKGIARYTSNFTVPTTAFPVL